MNKKYCWLLAAVGSLFLLSSCGKQETLPIEEENTDQTIALTVWGGEDDEELLKEMEEVRLGKKELGGNKR